MSRLHYTETGTGEALIMLHSGGMSGAEWKPQLRFLERHFRVIAVRCFAQKSRMNVHDTNPP